jgi:membrane-associated protein
MLSTAIEWVLYLDKYLAALAANHSVLVYVLLFAVVFIETGVVVMPFLPGDSLLFVAGAIAAKGMLSLPILTPLLILAAVAGDAMNFVIGSFMRGKFAVGYRPRLIKPEHLARTESFYIRHGRKTIVLARYVPVIRTLAPFVAALGRMPYGIFLAYNVIGGVLWVVSLVAAGYAFGNIQWVNDNLTLVLLGIIALSLLPGLFAWARQRGADKGLRLPSSK